MLYTTQTKYKGQTLIFTIKIDKLIADLDTFTVNLKQNSSDTVLFIGTIGHGVVAAADPNTVIVTVPATTTADAETDKYDLLYQYTDSAEVYKYNVEKLFEFKNLTIETE